MNVIDQAIRYANSGEHCGAPYQLLIRLTGENQLICCDVLSDGTLVQHLTNVPIFLNPAHVISVIVDWSPA